MDSLWTVLWLLALTAAVLFALFGRVGREGKQGPAGPAGPQGPIGPRGWQGPAGADGNDGRPGERGLQGVEGPQGPVGADGIDGPVLRGPWSASIDYDAGDMVMYQGSVYITDGTDADDVPPTNDDGVTTTEGWHLFAAEGAMGPRGPEGPEGPPGSDSVAIDTERLDLMINDLNARLNTIEQTYLSSEDGSNG